MYGYQSCGVAIVFIPSAELGNINRMVCIQVSGYVILLQGLVTYHAVKSVSFVVFDFYMLNYRRVCPKVPLGCDNISGGVRSPVASGY